MEEASCDSISLTPLMRFVANKLSTAAKRGQLVLSGVFQYSILSLLNRQEWVAAKAIQLLDEAGHDNDWLYDNAAIKGKGLFNYYLHMGRWFRKWQFSLANNVLTFVGT